MGKVLVYGGCGGLGRTVVEDLKAAGYWVLSGTVHLIDNVSVVLFKDIKADK